MTECRTMSKTPSTLPSRPFCLLSLLYPLPSLSLKSRFLKSSSGVWGSPVSFPARSGAECQPKSKFVHFGF